MSFTETAPYRFTNSVDLAITPEQLFDALADAEAWPRWASVIAESRDLDQYKPAHAERRAASGSSTMTSDADRMTRVALRGVS
jgi:uncharacterized protein YndB with AHSA1/START domain